MNASARWRGGSEPNSLADFHTGKDVKKTAKNWGHHVIAIDPDAMADGFAGRAASIIKTVAASHSEGVRLPGDSSNAIAAKNKNAGAIPVPKRIWDVITATAAKA